MKINEKGFWENPTKEGHMHDSRLAGAILRILKKRKCDTLVDFGCGTGDYAFFFRRHGIVVEAYDGNPHTEEISGGIGQVKDLSQPFDLKKYFKCILSLEVGEHISSEYEDTFLDNLVRHGRESDDPIYIISWAVPGQNGDGHVNCRTNEYIIEKMQDRGLMHVPAYTDTLRRSASLWWFKNTIMAFI